MVFWIKCCQTFHGCWCWLDSSACLLVILLALTRNVWAHSLGCWVPGCLKMVCVIVWNRPSVLIFYPGPSCIYSNIHFVWGMNNVRKHYLPCRNFCRWNVCVHRFLYNHGHYPEYNATCIFIIWKWLSSSPVLDQSYAFVATCSLILKDMVEWITWIC